MNGRRHFSGLLFFVSGRVFVHHAVIAWQGRRFNWIAAAIVNTAFGLVGMHLIYRELVRDQLAHRNARGLCLACGYDLTGNTSGVCPECGKPPPSFRHADRPFDSRRTTLW